jgi:hypothetical protein
MEMAKLLRHKKHRQFFCRHFCATVSLQPHMRKEGKLGYRQFRFSDNQCSIKTTIYNQDVIKTIK